MPTWLNIIVTVFYICWLCAVLVFLIFIWRNGNRRAQLMDKTRIDAALKAAEAAHIAAEAAHVIAEERSQVMDQVRTDAAVKAADAAQKSAEAAHIVAEAMRVLASRYEVEGTLFPKKIGDTLERPNA